MVVKKKKKKQNNKNIRKHKKTKKKSWRKISTNKYVFSIDFSSRSIYMQ